MSEMGSRPVITIKHALSLLSLFIERNTKFMTLEDLRNIRLHGNLRDVIGTDNDTSIMIVSVGVTRF